MTRHHPDLSSASDWLKRKGIFVSTNQKHYLDLGSNASPVWNFCARYSDQRRLSAQVATSRNVGCFLRLNSRSKRHFFNNISSHFIKALIIFGCIYYYYAKTKMEMFLRFTLKQTYRNILFLYIFTV